MCGCWSGEDRHVVLTPQPSLCLQRRPRSGSRKKAHRSSKRPGTASRKRRTAVDDEDAAMMVGDTNEYPTARGLLGRQ